MLAYNHTLTKKLIDKEASDEVLLKWILTLLVLNLEDLSKKQHEELKRALSKQGISFFSEDPKSILDGFREGMTKLIPPDGNSGAWKFKIDPGTIEIVREPLNPVIHKRIEGSFKTRFVVRFTDILYKFGLRLNRCPECSTVFLKTRRQEYCSKQCSQKMRTRKWYITHIEEIKQEQQKKENKHGA